MNRSCQTCHHFPETELKARVEEIQDRYFNLRNVALDSLMDLIRDIKEARANGTNPAYIQQAQEYQRKGQFMIDFIMSENSMGFHAPAESVRVLGDGINQCRLGQLALKGGPQPTHTVLAELPSQQSGH
jgi:nitrite reductase (cytochrome c-552)